MNDLTPPVELASSDAATTAMQLTPPAVLSDAQSQIIVETLDACLR